MQKKIPQRTCIACRNIIDKGKLLRIVKNANGEIFLDLTGKADGRGCYLCDNISCLEKCVSKRLLNRSFKMNVIGDVYDNIQKYATRKKD